MVLDFRMSIRYDFRPGAPPLGGLTRLIIGFALVLLMIVVTGREIRSIIKENVSNVSVNKKS